jgi:hypothetical protein
MPRFTFQQWNALTPERRAEFLAEIEANPHPRVEGHGHILAGNIAHIPVWELEETFELVHDLAVLDTDERTLNEAPIDDEDVHGEEETAQHGNGLAERDGELPRYRCQWRTPRKRVYI